MIETTFLGEGKHTYIHYFTKLYFFLNHPSSTALLEENCIKKKIKQN